MTANQDELLSRAVAEALRDPDFGRRLRRAIGDALHPRQRRRALPAFDPFAVYELGGEIALREALVTLDVERLKDVIAHHRMDRAKLAMKWRTSDRLIDWIIAQTTARAHKGEAFRKL